MSCVRNMRWVQIVIQHAATVLYSFVLPWPPVPCFPSRSCSVSQIETFPRLARAATSVIPPQQIPPALSEKGIRMPNAARDVALFLLRVSFETPLFVFWRVTRVDQLPSPRGGGWGWGGLIGMSDGNTAYIVPRARLCSFLAPVWLGVTCLRGAGSRCRWRAVKWFTSVNDGCETSRAHAK